MDLFCRDHLFDDGDRTIGFRGAALHDQSFPVACSRTRGTPVSLLFHYLSKPSDWSGPIIFCRQTNFAADR